MAWQTQDGTSINKKLVKHGSYNNSTFGNNANKVRAMQTLLYAAGSPTAAKTDNRIDGKWGAQSLGQAQNQGWIIGSNGDTVTRDGRIYNWDDASNAYVEDVAEQPAPKGRKIGIVDLDNLTDMQASDQYNYMRKNPNATEEDWANAYNGLHSSLQNDIEAGKLQGEFVGALMSTVPSLAASPAGARALGKGVTTLVSKAPKAVQTVTKVAPKAVKAATTVAKTATKAAGKMVGQAAKATRTLASKTASATGRMASAAGRTATGAARTAGNNARGAVNYVEQAVQNTGNKFTDYLTRMAKPQPVEMAPEGGNAYEGIEFINVRKNGGNIAKHQEGGDIQNKIVQLVQAAQQGDQQAIQQIQQIQQAAQQGDPQATQIMQFIQQIMQQAQSAKMGAALQYIKRIKGECPEGQELKYFKKGGSLCRACVEKEKANAADPVKAFKEKCGGKAKKAACGGKQPKSACGGAKLK